MEQRRWREIRMDEVGMNYKRRGKKKTGRKWLKVGYSLTCLQSGTETRKKRGTVWKTSGAEEDESHTASRNHRQHDEGLNFIATCYGNEWAVAGSGCVRVITSRQRMCE